MKKSSWRTTVGGWMLAAAPILHATLPDAWQWVSLGCACIGGVFMTQARDNVVTSEQAGAGK